MKPIEEIWKPVKDYEGLYEVSWFGRVRSIDRSMINKRGNKQFFKGRIRTLFISDNGYLRVRLSKNGIVKYHPVHRLVLQSFKIKPDGKDYCNHRDGNKTNNYTSNLEWCTLSENSIHAYKEGLASNKGERHSQSVLSDKEVIDIRTNYKGVDAKEIAKKYNVKIYTIHSILSRRTYKHL